MTADFWTTLCLLLNVATLVWGHARLLKPPSRASMWRLGFSMPASNYDDNQGYCGGRQALWSRFSGKCGVCGDAWSPVPRAHERGGRYFTGTVTETYKEGDEISIDVEITANHRGYFEFRICGYDNPEYDDVEHDSDGDFVEVSQECLDKQVLELSDGSGSRYYLTEPYRRGIHNVQLQLPLGFSCHQCLFQWKYNTANSWGKAPNGSSCVGCGPQEQFYACSDVSVLSSSWGGDESPRYVPTPAPTTTVRTTHRTTRTWDWWPTHRITTSAPSSITPNWWDWFWRKQSSTSRPFTTKSTLPRRRWPWWFTSSPNEWKSTTRPTPVHHWPWLVSPKKMKLTTPAAKRPGSWLEQDKKELVTKKTNVDFPWRETEAPEPTKTTTDRSDWLWWWWAGVPETVATARPSTPKPLPQQRPQQTFGCEPAGIWITLPGMKKWCIVNCGRGYCPLSHCSSGCKTPNQIFSFGVK